MGKLEKAIRRNSIFRDHANELRLARVNGLLTYAQDQSPASAVGQVLVEVARLKRVKLQRPWYPWAKQICCFSRPMTSGRSPATILPAILLLEMRLWNSWRTTLSTRF